MGRAAAAATSSTTASARSSSRATTPARSQHFAERGRARAARGGRGRAARTARADAATVAASTYTGSVAAPRCAAKRRDGIDYDARARGARRARGRARRRRLRAREVDLHARRLAGPRAAARPTREEVAAGARVRAREPRRAARRAQRRPRHQRPLDERRRHRHRPRPARRHARCSTQSRRLVRIGAGARWKDVAAFLAPHGWALSSGDYGGVGVGGLATAGGIGWLVREHGLTIDHVRAVELVLADGSHRASGCHAASRPLLGRSRRRRELRHRDRVRVRGRRGRRRRLRAARVRRERHRRVPAGVGRLGGRRAARPHELPHPRRRADRASRASRRSWRWSTPTTPTRCSPGCSRSPRPRRSSGRTCASRATGGHLELRRRRARRRGRADRALRAHRPHHARVRARCGAVPRRAGRRTSSNCAPSAAPCTTCRRMPRRSRTARPEFSRRRVRVEPAAHDRALGRAHRARTSTAPT